MKNSCQSPTLQEIIDLIGKDEAIKLVSQLGGVTYYFPLDGAEKQHVSINPKAWQALCKYFGGFVYIPNGKNVGLPGRNEEIKGKRRDGAKIIDLAIEYSLSDRQIKTICSGIRAPKLNHHKEDGIKQLSKLTT